MKRNNRIKEQLETIIEAGDQHELILGSKRKVDGFEKAKMTYESLYGREYISQTRELYEVSLACERLTDYVQTLPVESTLNSTAIGTLQLCTERYFELRGEVYVSKNGI